MIQAHHTYPLTPLSLCLIVCVISCIVSSVRVDAQQVDRIWIEPLTNSQTSWYPSALQIVEGEVLKFDGQQLQIATAERADDLVIRSDRVIWIEPAERGRDEQAAIDLYRSGDFASALTKLPAILKQRPPIWRQQWITMIAADAAWRSGRDEIALDLVRQLDRRSLPPWVLARLPIAWQREDVSRDVAEIAKESLSDPSPAVRLVAASWLLHGRDRTRAIDVLQQLRKNPRRPIAMLATVLIWRTATPPQVQQQARKWQQQLEQMPLVLQSGPSRMLFEKMEAAGMADEAMYLKWSTELTPIQPF